MECCLPIGLHVLSQQPGEKRNDTGKSILNVLFNGGLLGAGVGSEIADLDPHYSRAKLRAPTQVPIVNGN